MLDFFKIAIEKNRIGHSYLFVGEDEEEKKGVALEFVQLLNCPTKAPHPDLKVITPQDSLKIDEIRELQHWVSLKPYSAKWKVALILNGQLLTEEAANALLKTLEEPPAHSLLIISANSVQGLLPTIVSRCQIVRFPPSGDLLEKKDFGNPFESFDEKELLSKTKKELEEIFRAAFCWWRDVLICKLTDKEVFLFNKEKRQELKKQGMKYSLTDLEEKAEVISQTHIFLKQNVNPKIAFANMKLKLNEATI